MFPVLQKLPADSQFTQDPSASAGTLPRNSGAFFHPLNAGKESLCLASSHRNLSTPAMPPDKESLPELTLPTSPCDLTPSNFLLISEEILTSDKWRSRYSPQLITDSNCQGLTIKVQQSALKFPPFALLPPQTLVHESVQKVAKTKLPLSTSSHSTRAGLTQDIFCEELLLLVVAATRWASLDSTDWVFVHQNRVICHQLMAVMRKWWSNIKIMGWSSHDLSHTLSTQWFSLHVRNRPWHVVQSRTLDVWDMDGPRPVRVSRCVCLCGGLHSLTGGGDGKLLKGCGRGIFLQNLLPGNGKYKKKLNKSNHDLQQC